MYISEVFPLLLFFLLLRSQLYLYGSPFLVIFLYMWPIFFNPTIEVVTFCLLKWCMLRLFSVAGIHPSWTGMSVSF